LFLWDCGKNLVIQVRKLFGKLQKGNSGINQVSPWNPGKSPKQEGSKQFIVSPESLGEEIHTPDNSTPHSHLRENSPTSGDSKTFTKMSPDGEQKYKLKKRGP
jgi:hypothetical protein